MAGRYNDAFPANRMGEARMSAAAPDIFRQRLYIVNRRIAWRRFPRDLPCAACAGRSLSRCWRAPKPRSGKHAARFGEKGRLAVLCDVYGSCRCLLRRSPGSPGISGGSTGLINNAGSARIAPVERIREDEFRRDVPG